VMLVATPSAVAIAQSPQSLNRPAVKTVPAQPRAAATKQDLKNPRRNLAAHPSYFGVCEEHGDDDPACIKTVLAAIDHAWAAEHVKHPVMILPQDFTKLSAAKQTFVVTDLERVARGRRPFRGLTASLDRAAHHGAVTHSDPALSSSAMQRLKIEEYGSIWAGDLGPLAADYDWMYNDGYSAHGGINADCSTPSAAGCWGHRDNIIGAYSHLPNLIAGAGSGRPAGASLAEVLAAGPGKSGKLVYTWKDALDHGANGHRVTH
jgi:hypothetical protein